MATRFFGAQRSGHGPNWLLQDSEHPTSFTKDSFYGLDVVGGWFDCGDHVMFGQTQFFASYMLAKSLATFPNAWHDLYHGDYSDYKTSQRYDIGGGAPNGIPDLLEELRYQADFLVKITPNSELFIYQKGDGNLDHMRFVTAGVMSTLSRNLGGEAEGSRSILANPNDGNMPALASATLAVMARLDPDPERRERYIRHAVYALDYARKYSAFTGSAPFYPASDFNTRGINDAKANAALEIYRSTGSEAYRDIAWEYYLDPTKFDFNHSWRFDYANDEAVSLLNITETFGPNAWNSRLERWMDTARIQVDPNQNWVSTFRSRNLSTHAVLRFPTRSPLGFAFTHALFSQIRQTSEFDAFIYNQVDYLLGQNGTGRSYVVGWDKNGKTPPSQPHHRNVYGNTNPNVSQNAVGPIPERNKYLGAVIGGALDGSYDTNIDNYSMNEPCLDLNAPLVGALAYVVQKLSPTPSPLPVYSVPVPLLSPVHRLGEGFQLEQVGSRARVLSQISASYKMELYDLSGRRSLFLEFSGTQSPWISLPPGVQLLRIRSPRQSQVFRLQ